MSIASPTRPRSVEAEIASRSSVAALPLRIVADQPRPFRVVCAPRLAELAHLWPQSGENGSIQCTVFQCADILEVSAALFNVHAGVELESVPFRGTAPALNALLSNTIQVMFVPPASVLSYIEAGQMRAVGFTGDVRPRELPNVPFVKDAVPTLKIQGAWHGWLAPAKTPPQIVEALSKQAIESLKSPKVLELIRRSGYEPLPMGPTEFGVLLRENAQQMAEAARAAKIEPQ